jgi:rhamnogalacturonyl hydrolase YesR
MNKKLFLLIALLTASVIHGAAQETAVKITDTNTPLHAMKPDYPVPYGPAEAGEIEAVLDRLLSYLETSTPARMIDSKTKAELNPVDGLTRTAIFDPGVFRLISYEWGVTYGAMLLAGEATGDDRFTSYVLLRMSLIADAAKYFGEAKPAVERRDNPVGSVLEPRALDDAGSMCSAMIKTLNAGGSKSLRPLIDNYIKYISTSQQRLNDGTLARNRPQPNTLWLDDLYMSVPALARMGSLTGNNDYYEDACRQIIQFSQRMFNPAKGLYMHGWVEDMNPHPEYYWGRCNGWAMLAMTELLDALPEGYPLRKNIMKLYHDHVAGVASLQSGSGFWHQLLDRNDSYPETSATAIFTYCIAHGVNMGWLDPKAYGPVSVLGWNAVQTKVNEQGQVEGTCVGTGMAFDPAFYYHRPVHPAAAHGYGPVIMAGAEMLKLTRNFEIEINDSAVMFYKSGTDWRNYRY